MGDEVILAGLVGLLLLAGLVWLLMSRKGDGEVVPPTAPTLIDEPPDEIGAVAEALPAGVKPVLEFEGPPGAVTVDKPRVVIGRHSADDIRLSDLRVSRHHAVLVARPDGRFEIHNQTAALSDPNPILVNGRDLEHAVLSDGDRVTIGPTDFTFRLARA